MEEMWFGGGAGSNVIELLIVREFTYLGNKVGTSGRCDSAVTV